MVAISCTPHASRTSTYNIQLTPRQHKAVLKRRNATPREMMAADPNSSHVRVGVRVRPLTSKEASDGGKVVVDAVAFDQTVTLSKHKFTFDSVFPSSTTQSDLYANVSPPLLASFLGGYNATILAYGQTGAGKTHTMGSEAGGDFVENMESGCNLRDHDGIIPRFMSDMFASLSERQEAYEKALLQSSGDASGVPEQLTSFSVNASFLEVYGEDVYDLLDEDRNSLKIREDSNKEVIVVGLKSTFILSALEAMNLLNTGTTNRTTASTLMNTTSSRSHAIFTVNLQQTTRSLDGDELTTMSRFTFVDLAGSERMKKTGAQGERAREGIRINEGLLALGNVINALADDERLAKGEKVHVPYRQTKLTRLLQDALGGNSQTLFLACVSPSDTNATETLSTLHYANRARNIQNRPSRNVDATVEELRRLRILTNLLKCELVKQRFDGVSASTAVDPEVEVEKSNASAQNQADIGIVDENLLRRDDVLAYMKQIDDKVLELSGTTSDLTLQLSARPSSVSDRSMPHAFVDAPLSQQPVVTPQKDATNVHDNDGGYLDVGVNPDEDIELADDFMDKQRGEQLRKKDNMRGANRRHRPSFVRDSVLKLEGENRSETQKKITKLEAECQRYKANLEHSKMRYEKLSDKLKQTESNLKKTESNLKKILSGPKSNVVFNARQDREAGANGLGQFAPPSGEVASIKFMLDKIVSDRVTLAQNRGVYASKVAEREELMRSMAREVETLNEIKRECTMESETSDEVLTEMKNHEDNAHDFYAQIEIVESSLEELRARYPTVEDDGKEESKNSIFEDHEPALKIIRELNGPLLRTLILNLLGSFFVSELGRRTLKDALAKSHFTLSTLEGELSSQNEKISILSRALERKSKAVHSNEAIECLEQELKDARVELESLAASHTLEMETLRSNLESQNKKIGILSKALERQSKETHSGEDIRTLERSLKHANSKLDSASASKARELEKLRSDLESSASLEVQCVQAAAEEQRISDIERITADLNQSHAADIEQVKSAMMDMADSLQSKQLKQLARSHKDEMDQMKNEMEALESQLKDADSRLDMALASHAKELEKLRLELELKDESHAANIEQVKSAMMAMSDSLHSKRLEQLAISHKGERDQLNAEIQALESQLKEVSSKLDIVSASRAEELDKLRLELELSASFELQRVQAAAEEHCISETARVTNSLNRSHAADIEKVKSEMKLMADSSQSDLLKQLASCYKEMARIQAENEALVCELKDASSKLESESASHECELVKLRSDFELYSHLELQRAQAAAEERRIGDIERVTIGKVKSEVMAMADSLHSKQLEQLAISHKNEMDSANDKIKALSSQLNDANSKLDLASASHAKELETLRLGIESLVASELQRVHVEAEEQRISEIAHITSILNQSHAVDIENVKSGMMSMADLSQIEQLQQLVTSQKEEISRKHDRVEALECQLKEASSKLDSMSAFNVHELVKLRSDLESYSYLELQRAQAAAEERHVDEIERITNNLKKSHTADIEKVKSEMMGINSLQSEHLERVAKSHKEQMARMQYEVGVLETQLNGASSKLVIELENLRSELKSLASSKHQRVYVAAEEQYVSEIERITNELKQSHAANIGRFKLDMMTELLRSEQLEHLAFSQKEELVGVGVPVE